MTPYTWGETTASSHKQEPAASSQARRYPESAITRWRPAVWPSLPVAAPTRTRGVLGPKVERKVLDGLLGLPVGAEARRLVHGQLLGGHLPRHHPHRRLRRERLVRRHPRRRRQRSPRHRPRRRRTHGEEGAAGRPAAVGGKAAERGAAARGGGAQHDARPRGTPRDQKQRQVQGARTSTKTAGGVKESAHAAGRGSAAAAQRDGRGRGRCVYRQRSGWRGRGGHDAGATSTSGLDQELVSALQSALLKQNCSVHQKMLGGHQEADRQLRRCLRRPHRLQRRFSTAEGSRRA